MKCDELTIYDGQWCDKSEVDEAIAELKEKLHDVDNQWNEQCKEVAQLKAKLVVLQSFYDLHGNVDNFIDRLEEENKELKDKLHNVSELLKETREWLIESQKLHKRCADNAVKVIRHQKYKRCLAVARWCEFRSRYYDLLIKVEASYLLSNPHNVHKYERKAFRSKSWRIKWLELAEKFKPNKEAK